MSSLSPFIPCFGRLLSTTMYFEEVKDYFFISLKKLIRHISETKPWANHVAFPAAKAADQRGQCFEVKEKEIDILISFITDSKYTEMNANSIYKAFYKYWKFCYWILFFCIYIFDTLKIKSHLKKTRTIFLKCFF